MSGIQVDDSCLGTFNELKSKKAHRFIIFKIINDTTINVVATGARDQTYDNFVATLKGDEPCYAIFDFDFDLEGSPRNKLLLISWIPDTAKIKAKTVYASSKDALVQKVGGGTTNIQASDFAEVSHERVLAKVKAGTRA